MSESSDTKTPAEIAEALADYLTGCMDAGAEASEIKVIVEAWAIVKTVERQALGLP